MEKYDELSNFIIKKVGGSENIIGLTHCMTRLRFTVKDFALIDEEALRNANGIATAQKAGGQYQVVIGTHVGEVYNTIIMKIGAKQIEESEKSGALNAMIQIITKVITPALGILMASGLIQGLLAILSFSGMVATDDGAYIILNAMGQSIFQFLPIILGYTASKAFKLDPMIGMIIGAALVFPNLVGGLASGEAITTLFSNSFLSTEIYKTFFGIPIMFPAMGYGSTVIPIIFIIYFAAKLHEFLKKRIPDSIGYTLVPFLTILISVPISILIIGPVTNVLSDLIALSVSAAFDFSPMIASIIVALVYQPLVILGLHWPLITIGMQNLASMGSDFILPTLFTASFAQLAVVAAVYVRTKKVKTKAICVPAMISALFCIIEPAIYGITLPVKKRFAFSMIGGAVGSVILTLFNTKMYATVVGIFGFVSFINPSENTLSGVVIAVAAVLVSMIVAFLFTYFTFDEEATTEKNEDIKKANLSSSEKTIIVNSPLEGTVSELESAQDPVFSKGLLGKGVLIHPTSNKVLAPIDGIITTLFPTAHAVGITSDTGVEVLIHVGKDTVKMNGRNFTKLKEQNDYVKKGEPIIEFDIDEIQREGYIIETPVIITNSQNYEDIEMKTAGTITFSETLISIKE